MQVHLDRREGEEERERTSAQLRSAHQRADGSAALQVCWKLVQWVGRALASGLGRAAAQRPARRLQGQGVLHGCCCGSQYVGMADWRSGRRPQDDEWRHDGIARRRRDGAACPERVARTSSFTASLHGQRIRVEGHSKVSARRVVWSYISQSWGATKPKSAGRPAAAYERAASAAASVSTTAPPVGRSATRQARTNHRHGDPQPRARRRA